MSLSTHVLDTTRGQPAARVPVLLHVRRAAEWVEVASGSTDMDGRLRDWIPETLWLPGTYRLTFDTADYLGADAFFPEVTVVFRVADVQADVHVPLLLSRFGYTTYRGS